MIPTTLNVWNQESTALSRASVRARDRTKPLSHSFAGMLSVANGHPPTTDDRRQTTDDLGGAEHARQRYMTG